VKDAETEAKAADAKAAAAETAAAQAAPALVPNGEGASPGPLNPEQQAKIEQVLHKD
jgi:hypothetical protein